MYVVRDILSRMVDAISGVSGPLMLFVSLGIGFPAEANRRFRRRALGVRDGKYRVSAQSMRYRPELAGMNPSWVAQEVLELPKVNTYLVRERLECH